MKKLFSLFLFNVCLIMASFAQDKISKGTKVTILEIASSDTYYSERSSFVGSSATTSGELTKKSTGYYSGTLETSTGRTCFFTGVKLSVSSDDAPKSSISSNSSIKYVTGTIAKGTSVYVADISPDDSYYSDRQKYIGKRGKVDGSEMSMKEDGYYAGSFKFDDSSTAYFYKAKFSKTPVAKLSGADVATTKSSSTTDYSGLYDLFGSGSSNDWDDAKNDDDIKKGDIVKVTAVGSDDSYYDDREKYEGKQGVTGDDVEYDSETGGYGGTVKLDDGTSPYFYSVKLQRVKSGTFISTLTQPTSTTTTNSSSNISKGTRVVVVDLGKEDSFYGSKDTYIGKTGKVADGMTLQTGGYYSGKVLFDDGTDAYFFNAKVTVLK